MKTCAAILLVVLSAMLACGCGKIEPGASAGKPAKAVQAAKMQQEHKQPYDFVPDQSKYGTVTECPVNRKKFVVGKNTPAAKYQGSVYYMCCPECLDQFKKAPEQYKKR